MAKTVAAIHISTRVINGLALRPLRKGWSVTGGASLDLPPAEGDAEPVLGPSFKALARAIHHKGHGPTTLVLAKQAGILRTVRLPSTDPAELAQMARFEAERHIPFNAERHSVGFHIMRSQGVEGSEVLLGAIDGPVVTHGLEGLTAAGLLPEGISMSSTALVNSLLYVNPAASTAQTVAILSIGLDSVDLVLLNAGRVIYARSVAMDLRSALEAWLGRPSETGHAPADPAKLAVAAHMIDCQQLDGAETAPASHDPANEGTQRLKEWIERIGREFLRTRDFARRELKCPELDRLILSGEGAILRGLDKVLSQGIGLPVEILNPVAALPGAERLKFPFGGLEHTIAFGAIIGRYQAGAYRLDLTPADHYRRLARRATIRRLAVSGVLLLVTAGLATASFLRYSELSRQELSDYQAINRTMLASSAELKEMQEKTEIIKRFVNDPDSALKVFGSVILAPQIPTAAFLDSFSYVRQRSTNISGIATSIEVISALKSDLNGTGHFTTIVSNQSPIDLLGHPMQSFTIECTLPRDVKERQR